MHILAGLVRPTEGEASIAGTDITRLDDTQLTKLRRNHIGFIFQFFNLLPMLTAEENIVLPLTLAGRNPENEFFDDLLGKVGLKDRLKHRPTGNLDSKTGADILDLLRGSVQDYGQTLVMVTHDARAAATADRILFLADGQIVRDMPRSDQHEVITAMEELAAK